MGTKSRKILLKTTEIDAWIVAFSCIINLGPYFIWPTFSLTMSRLPVFIYLISTFIVIKNANKKVLHSTIFLMLFFSVLWFYTLFTGYTNQFIVVGQYVPPLMILGLLLDDEKKQANIFRKFKLLFIISLIPGMVFWVFKVVGIPFPFPFTYLESPNQAKTLVGGYYNNYFFFVERLDLNIISKLPHLCGIYDEQGLVGTFAALFLLADYFDLKKDKWNVLLFIQGFMTLSLAYYLMIIIGLGIKIVMNKSYKKALKRFCFSILTLVIVCFVVIKITPNDSIFAKVFLSRFQFINGTFGGNNRLHSYFASEYEMFKLNIIDYIFGLGRGSYALLDNPDSSTYLILIYEYGIVGFLGIMVFYLYLALKKGMEKLNYRDLLPFVIVFMISIYQRPYILTISYMVLYITGLSNIYIKQTN